MAVVPESHLPRDPRLPLVVLGAVLISVVFGLVAGQAVRERVRIGVRDAHQLFKCRMVAVAGGGHQFGEITDVLWHTEPF